jgi:hypothetical protein
MAELLTRNSPQVTSAIRTTSKDSSNPSRTSSEDAVNLFEVGGNSLWKRRLMKADNERATAKVLPGLTDLHLSVEAPTSEEN